MVTPNSMPVSASQQSSLHSPDNAELIDRLARELRASSDRNLPHSFYVAQIKRQMASKSEAGSIPANDTGKPKRPASIHESSAVFCAWAIPD